MKVIYKPVGATPLMALQKVGVSKSISKPVSYAGRLDPMAEGVMVVLEGEENKNRDKYLNLDKEYEFEVLFGVRTDSYDLLGVPEESLTAPEVNSVDKFFRDKVEDYVGKYSQPYPAYSGKTIDGIKMFDLAKTGQLANKTIPTKDIEIYTIEVLELGKISESELLKEIKNKISLVVGDFRQDEVVASWKKLLKDGRDFPLVRIRVSCSAGTYVRSLSARMGNDFGSGAIAYSIKRTRVDKFTISDCINRDEAGVV